MELARINLLRSFCKAKQSWWPAIGMLLNIVVSLTCAAVLSSAFFSCRQKPVKDIQRGFYYWKSEFKITAHERQQLDELHVKKIYTKFFDVVWNAEQQVATPVAKLQTDQKAAEPLQIIPVVFITNETMTNINTKDVAVLASNIISLIKGMQQNAGFKVAVEWQIDCDWTAGTKEKYFALLQQIKSYTTDNDILLSATIRLYQCKYLGKTGVPPVDRGLLMCYNMGNLKNPQTVNSILEIDELKKYAASLETYPLELDVALPLFDWKVLYRNRQYAGLINGLPDSLLTSTIAIQQDGNRFTFLKDTSIDNYSFKSGDMLRDEQSSYDAIKAAAELVNDKLRTTKHSVALYHLDSITLSKYSRHELETMFGSFH